MNRNVILSLMALVFVSANAQDVVPAQNDNKAITLGSEYRDWHGDIDYINIVEPIDVRQYNTIHLMNFDYTNVEIPEKTDNRYPALMSALSKFPEIISSKLRDRYKDLNVVINDGSQQIGANELSLELKVDKLDMGSRAARFWGGFGAGAQRFKISVVVRDASGKNLFNFTHERHSTNVMTYEKCLLTEMENFAKDIVYVFKKI